MPTAKYHMLTNCATMGAVSGRYRKWSAGTVFRVPEDVPAGEFDHLGPGRYEIRPAGDQDREVRPNGSTPGYEIESRGGGWYDVVNSATGETLNTEALRKEEAEDVLARLGS